MPNTFWGRDINAPDTNWRPSSEDPLPYLFSRFPAGGFIYRWFSLRPLDGHARSDATLMSGGTTFYSRSGHAPFPGAWFHSMPRWKQGLFTRMPVSLWALSFVVSLRLHVFTAYLLAYVHGATGLGRGIWEAVSWLWS